MRFWTCSLDLYASVYEVAHTPFHARPCTPKKPMQQKNNHFKSSIDTIECMPHFRHVVCGRASARRKHVPANTVSKHTTTNREHIFSTGGNLRSPRPVTWCDSSFEQCSVLYVRAPTRPSMCKRCVRCFGPHFGFCLGMLQRLHGILLAIICSRGRSVRRCCSCLQTRHAVFTVPQFATLRLPQRDACKRDRWINLAACLM